MSWVTLASGIFSVLGAGFAIYSRMMLRKAGKMQAELALLRKENADLKAQIRAEQAAPLHPEGLARQLREEGL